jgi:hypothetical protein
MEPFQARTAGIPPLDALTTFADGAAVALQADDRVRALWLTGSLAAGTADPQSDVDLRAAVRPEHFVQIGDWWDELIERISPAVWKRRWPGPPNEAITSAISTDYIRFDLVVQSAGDTAPHALDAARLLFDKDGLAEQIDLTTTVQHNPLASLTYTVEEFIRLLGMLPIVAGRGDVPIGMEGQMGCHSLLISLLLMENGIDRMVLCKRHVVVFLTDEQRDIIASVPPLAPTMASIIDGRIAYARLFLPRARRLMAANGMAYPDTFEAATLCHLKDQLHLDI